MPNLSHFATKSKPRSNDASRAPVTYQITPADRERHAARHWRMPPSLVPDGTWAALWAAGQPITSVLVVLAVHATFRPGVAWSEWWNLRTRKLAVLAGVSRTSVVQAMAVLRTMGLLETRRRPHPEHAGLSVCEYRLSAGLFAAPGAPFVKVAGDLVYSGHWRELDSNAARHLSLAVRALDPVQDEEAYIEELISAGDPDDEPDELDYCVFDGFRADAWCAVAKLRATAKPSAYRLGKVTGISPREVRRLLPQIPAWWQECSYEAWVFDRGLRGPR